MGENAAAPNPHTDRLLAEAFSDCLLISAQRAARVLGVDEKTLREMAEGGVIQSVIVGASTRRYTEADLRALLAGERFGEVQKRCTAPVSHNEQPKRSAKTAVVVDIGVLAAQHKAAAKTRGGRRA